MALAWKYRISVSIKKKSAAINGYMSLEYLLYHQKDTNTWIKHGLFGTICNRGDFNKDKPIKTFK